MGKLSDRWARVRQAGVRAAQDLERDQKVSKAIDEANKYLAKLDRPKANAAIARVKKLLAAQYSERSLDTWCKALRHPKRFHWEKGANGKEEVPASVLSAERGTTFEIFCDSNNGDSVEYPEPDVRKRASIERKANPSLIYRRLNVLHAMFEDEFEAVEYRTFAYWRMGRCLIRLLTGDLREPDLGERLLRELMMFEHQVPTSESAHRFVNTGGMNISDPQSFLDRLYDEVPGAVEAVDRLLTAYNALTRAEWYQQRENAKARARREDKQRAKKAQQTNGSVKPRRKKKQISVDAPEMCELILPTTQTEQQLELGSKSDRLQFALTLATYLLGCGTDHLAKALGAPQQRFRVLVAELEARESTFCQTNVVTKVEAFVSLSD